MFEQTIKDLEDFCRGIAGIGMKYSDIRDHCL